MKKISTANKGLKALAKENPALVEDKFGYDVPGYQDGDLVDFLNADPEQRIFGIETQIRNLMLDYQDAVKKKGLSGKDALHSDEFKDFRKQSNDLKIMLSKAMEIMTKDAGATGKILKGTGKIIK